MSASQCATSRWWRPSTSSTSSLAVLAPPTSRPGSASRPSASRRRRLPDRAAGAWKRRHSVTRSTSLIASEPPAMSPRTAGGAPCAGSARRSRAPPPSRRPCRAAAAPRRRAAAHANRGQGCHAAASSVDRAVDVPAAPPCGRGARAGADATRGPPRRAHGAPWRPRRRPGARRPPRRRRNGSPRARGRCGWPARPAVPRPAAPPTSADGGASSPLCSTTTWLPQVCHRPALQLRPDLVPRQTERRQLGPRHHACLRPRERAATRAGTRLTTRRPSAPRLAHDPSRHGICGQLAELSEAVGPQDRHQRLTSRHHGDPRTRRDNLAA